MSVQFAAPPELMTRAEAADYIGVKEQTLAVWACANRYGLPFVKVGRLCRYRRSDLDAWLAQRTRCPGDVDE